MKDAKVIAPGAIEDMLDVKPSGTGFVVDVRENVLKIATSAHLIDSVFTKKKPISVQELNKLFVVRVLCDHADVHYLEGIAARRRRHRAYSPATVCGIDCVNDLLLIEIPINRVFRSISAAGVTTVCNCDHPPIPYSLNPPEPEALNKSVLISWPSERHLTTTEGRVSHWSRTIDVMPGDNVHGYDMSLIQVGIRSEIGASGSPLLNAQGECFGMLHGGDGQFSYFVSLRDLVQFLNHHGIERRI